MCQTRYPWTGWVFKSRFSFKVRQHCQKQLYLQYKVCWILYKMVGATSFPQPYLWIQPLFSQLSRLFLYLLKSTFTSLFNTYFLKKSFLQSLLTLPFSLPQQFFTSVSLRKPSQQSTPKIFSLPQPFSCNHFTSTIQISTCNTVQ